MIFKRIYLLATFIVLACSFTKSSAQSATNSPYSTFGIGKINGKGFGNNFAMGGSNIALQNDSLPVFFINNGNPASYVSNQLTTIDVGVTLNRTSLKDENGSATLSAGGIGNFAMAFPIKKWWGTSIGLTPYTSVGYNTAEQDNVTEIGDIEYLYTGSGGVNQIYWGNGFRPFKGLEKRFMNSTKYNELKKNFQDSTIAQIRKRQQILEGLSLGANISYMRGSLNYNQSSTFPSNSQSLFDTRATTAINVSDVHLDFGLQYKYTLRSWKGEALKEKLQLFVGATFSPSTALNTKTDSIVYSYFTNSIGVDIPKDTIKNSSDTKGQFQLPTSFGFGLGFSKGKKWLITSDFKFEEWSKIESGSSDYNFTNRLRVSAGAQFIPNNFANEKWGYFQRINYRFGARYLATHIVVNENQLTEQALTFGFGFPVGRNFVLNNFSMVNLNFELGQRGTGDSKLTQERFFNTSINFTLNEKWFQKRKYN